MSEKKITTSQLGITLLICSFSAKLLFMPSIIYQDAKVNSLFSLALLFFIDGILLLFICLFLKKNKNSCFFEIISKKTTNLFAKIIYFLLFIYFFIKLCGIICGSYFFFSESIFSTATYTYFVAIVLFLSTILAFGSIQALVRTNQFFYRVILIGLVICLIIGFTSVNFEFPMHSYDVGAVDVFKTSFTKLFWFGDPLILLMFCGKIDIRQKFTKKLFFYWGIVVLLVFLLIICYFGLYQETSVMHKYALADIVIFAPRISAVGRLDLFPLITMMFLILLQSSIYHKMLLLCFDNINKKIKASAKMFVINVLLVIFLLFIFNNDNSTFNFMENYMSFFSVFLIVFIAFFIIINLFRKKKVKYEKNFK